VVEQDCVNDEICGRRKFRRIQEVLCNSQGSSQVLQDLGLVDVRFGQLGVVEENWVKNDPSHLIIWRINSEIIGHAIWHETGTDEMKEGDHREEEDEKMLRRLLVGKRENLVELHEIWLRREYRGKGYGKQFFDFFESISFFICSFN